jgi:hypothetical protein
MPKKSIEELKREIMETVNDPQRWAQKQREWGIRDAKEGTPPAHFDDPYYAAYMQTLRELPRHYR